MTQRRSNGPLLAGLLISLILHVIVLLPAMIQVMSSDTPVRIVRARFEPDVFRSPEEPEEPEVMKLGIEEGSPSTLTWIGYEEYEKHIAELSDVEQAAFQEEPTGSEQPIPVTLRQPFEPVEPVPPTETPPDVEPIVTAAVPEDQQGEEPKSPARDDQLALQPEPVRQTAVPILLDELLVARADAIIAAIEDLLSQAREAPQPTEGLSRGVQKEPAETPKEEPRPQPNAQPPSPTAAAAQPMPRPPDAPPPGSPNQGDQADKESDATSLQVPYEDIRAGKPVAARGLELKPQKPEFTVLLRVTAAPGNPLCEMHFDRTGRPMPARILKSSGDSRVDDVIRASLYRWRASGKPLEQLAEGETIPVQIWIILNPRARMPRSDSP